METETYWSRALKQSEKALKTGSLVPLNTTLEHLKSSTGSHFELRTLKSRLPKHLKREGPKPNPFQPWDPQLEVARLNQSHALILNKYPVQRGHMLLITADWAAQDGWLTLEDWTAFVEIDHDTSGLWFFNSGPIAGASQPHRHLQLLPRNNDAISCPRDPWFQEQLSSLPSITTTRDVLLKGCSVISRFRQNKNQAQQAHHLYDCYLTLSEQLGIGHPSQDERPKSFYNLLITPQWIAMVRRRQEGASGFSINALGFAGYLLATDSADLDWLRTHGPEALLREVVF